MLIRLAITAIILFFLARGIDMGDAGRAIAAIDLGYLALVLGLVAVDRCVMIWRWILLLRARDIKVTNTEAARIFLVSSFVGSFLPAGVGADAARAYSLSRDSATGSDALASVVVDRLLGVVALLVLGVIGVIAWTPGDRTDWRVAAAVLALSLGCAAALWIDEVLRRLIPARHHDSFLIRRALKIADAVGRYRGHRGALAHVMLWSIVVQVLRTTQAYFLGIGLGVQVPFAFYLFFMPIGLLALLLPISFSGFGLPQGVMVWLLRPLGVPDSQSFALSTLIILTGLAGNLPGLWLWLRQRREIL